MFECGQDVHCSDCRGEFSVFMEPGYSVTHCPFCGGQTLQGEPEAEIKRDPECPVHAWARLDGECSCDAYSLKYHDLLMQVETKHPGESRHQTAKRYIHERENRQPQTGFTDHDDQEPVADSET